MSFKFVKDFKNLDPKKIGQQFLGIYKSGKTTEFPEGVDYNDIYVNGSAPNKNFSENLGYGFSVRNSDNTKATGWGKFILQINPQQLQQDEEFSIQFFPTPSGITVEQQGSIMKKIVISGTTGIHPKKGAGGVDKNGELILASGNSGFKEFHDLRNYIRAYQEAKRKPENKDLRLVFLNYKDSEYLVCECTNFQMRRQSNRPHLYDYTIHLNATGRVKDVERDTSTLDDILGTIDNISDTVLNSIRVSRGVISGSVDLLRRVDRGIRESKTIDFKKDLKFGKKLGSR